MERIHADVVRLRLEARLGISLSVGRELVGGAYFEVIRPDDLEVGQGFCVALARTPRQVLASVHVDTYAGRLLREMSKADEEGKYALCNLLRIARQSGVQVSVELGGRPPEEAFSSELPWRSLEIEAAKRVASKPSEEDLYNAITDCASICVGSVLALVTVEELRESVTAVGAVEGGLTRVEVNRYERSPANRAACIAFHGCHCKGCGFSFREAYGELADGFIEVHHLTPVSAMGEGYLVNPIEDLVPLCPNCHAVVHRTSPPLTLEQLRGIVSAMKVKV